MRQRKQIFLGIAVVAALLLAGGWALAHGPWGQNEPRYPGHGGGCHWNLPPEQEQKISAEQQKFYQETAPLRRELHQKRLELKALWIDPKADRETIRSKQREVLDLQRQFQEKRLEHQLAVRDLLPEDYLDESPWGMGPLRGHHRWSKRGPTGGYESDGGRRFCW
jgi:Spy/CpxP family protein refolding chaperone